MIDLHNHVLPGVDDGARDLDQALRMLDIAVTQGITHVACTPHASDRANAQTNDILQRIFAELCAAVADRAVPVQLLLGAEIMLGAELLRVLDLPLATYGGKGRYFLLEFPLETPFEIILNVVKSARRAGRTPVLAHFERFSRAQRSADQVQQLRAEGAVISLDAGSLVSQFGPVMLKRARTLLEWNVVDLLCSDAHDDGDHGFCLKAGRDAAAQIVGASEAAKLVLDHPRRIWEDEPWPATKDER